MKDFAPSRPQTFSSHTLPYTWADVYEALGNGSLIASECYAKKLRGSLSKIARVVHHLDRTQLHLIPASLEAFDEQVGIGPITMLPSGAKNAASFKHRRDEARLALKHFLASVATPAPAVPSDIDIVDERAAHAVGAWRALATALHDYWDEEFGKNVKFKAIGFNVLKANALKARIAPQQITITWVEGLLKRNCGASTKTSYLGAAKIIDSLRADPDFPRHDLLPRSNVTPEQKPGKRRNGEWRPLSLTIPLDEWIDHLRSGRREVAPGLFIEDEPLKKNTLASYRNGVHWFFDSLDALGFNETNANPAPKDIADPKLFVACIRASRNGDLQWTQLADGTVRGYVGSAIRWLQDENPELSRFRTRINRLSYFQSTGPSNELKAWCLQFMTSRKMQARFGLLPKTLFDAARRAFAVYDQMDPVEKAKTINLCIAAVSAAVLTVFPLRSSTWLQLTIDTPGADIWLDPNRQNGKVHFRIPASKIKRRKAPFEHTIAPRVSSSAWEIIQWFCEGPRKALMRNHMSTEPDPILLLGGIKYGRLAHAWSVATRHALIPMPLHRVRHAIATIAINLCPDNIGPVASLLGISESVAGKVYAFINEQQRLLKIDDQLRMHEHEFVTFGHRLS